MPGGAPGQLASFILWPQEAHLFLRMAWKQEIMACKILYLQNPRQISGKHAQYICIGIDGDNEIPGPTCLCITRLPESTSGEALHGSCWIRFSKHTGLQVCLRYCSTHLGRSRAEPGTTRAPRLLTSMCEQSCPFTLVLYKCYFLCVPWYEKEWESLCQMTICQGHRGGNSSLG